MACTRGDAGQGAIYRLGLGCKGGWIRAAVQGCAIICHPKVKNARSKLPQSKEL